MAKGGNGTRTQSPASSAAGRTKNNWGTMQAPVTSAERASIISSQVSKSDIVERLRREISPEFRYFGDSIEVHVLNTDMDDYGNFEASVEVFTARKKSERSSLQTNSYQSYRDLASDVLETVNRHVHDYSTARELIDEYIYDNPSVRKKK